MKHLKYLNKFLWKYRTLLIVGSFFIVVANLFALYPAEFVRIAFDTVILNMNSNIEDTIEEETCTVIVLTAIAVGIIILVFSLLS